MRDMLALCNKNVDFSMNSATYIQIDDVVTGCPLGPPLAGILMVKLKRSLGLRLSNYIKI